MWILYFFYVVSIISRSIRVFECGNANKKKVSKHVQIRIEEATKKSYNYLALGILNVILHSIVY